MLHCETPQEVTIETEPKHTGAQNKRTHAEVQLQTGRARQSRKQRGGGIGVGVGRRYKIKRSDIIINQS